MQRAANGTDGTISLRFDSLEIHHHQIPVVTSLRALAGFMEVQAAQTPEFTTGYGTPLLEIRPEYRDREPAPAKTRAADDGLEHRRRSRTLLIP